MSIGSRIKIKRTEQGYTLEEVAIKMGTSKQTIQRYESGTISNIPSDKIEALAIVLKTTPSFLMGWENETDLQHLSLSSHEECLITAYRSQPDLQKAVDRLLGIDATPLQFSRSQRPIEIKTVAFGGDKKTITTDADPAKIAHLLRQIDEQKNKK